MQILHSLANGHDLADAIAPEHVRQLGLGRIQRLREEGVGGIQRRKFHVEHNLSGTRLWIGNLIEPQFLNALI